MADRALTHEECLAILFADDPPPPPLKSFALNEPSGRHGFLDTLARMGEEGLFAAVSHNWTSLNPPRAWRCIAIGQAAGVGGQGKNAILLALTDFLDKAADLPMPLPEQASFASLEDWSVAVSGNSAADERAYRLHIASYAGILDGKTKIKSMSGQVIKGPWRRRTKDPRRGLPRRP